ncbi:uracil-DNA glycosylase [Candidatus Peregrinibacteria bacterium CG_4_10_14_0_2_um_filter_38_24]|nr:MAG: uracil-DNA glycosylase [Candidatus Peregrinibacteria bacterium CG_4_10_14_0_2_um_filter_38_24]PJC38605.1 MAG: uracil-DNA glycosylase [Candidatus Peregrinibacteria bacterium CG_4_9_14_0_2_um_filter_38_9]
MTLTEDIINRINVCKKCPLHKGRTHSVPGDGSYNAEIMFIGEGPGRDEDLQGKPFVGAAGKLLIELIKSIGLSREDVFIANVVKCRPPNNRDPLPEEIAACWPYLDEQVKIIKPLLVVTLGRHSMGRFLPGLKISEVHGQPKSAKSAWNERQAYLPLYHPAVALYDPRKKVTLFEDFEKIPLILKQVKKEKNVL